MQFTKLRLQGFKPFVDPAEFVISTELTGVVGPSGRPQWLMNAEPMAAHLQLAQVGHDGMERRV